MLIDLLDHLAPLEQPELIEEAEAEIDRIIDEPITIEEV